MLSEDLDKVLFVYYSIVPFVNFESLGICGGNINGKRLWPLSRESNYHYVYILYSYFNVVPGINSLV
jgi:hypothetical protein